MTEKEKEAIIDAACDRTLSLLEGWHARICVDKKGIEREILYISGLPVRAASHVARDKIRGKKKKKR